MITVFIQQLDTSRHSWDAVHIFEHVFINGFYRFIRKEGYDPALIGWLGGETFEERLFIDAGFYDPAVAQYFEKYSENTPSFHRDDIEIAIKQAEAEDKVKLKFDQETLMQVVDILRLQSWNKLLNQRSVSTNETPLITITKSAISFRDIAISVGSNHLTVEEQKVFLRLRSILNDIIYYYFFGHMQTYYRGSSPVIDQNNNIKFIMVITCQKTKGKLVPLATKIEGLLDEYSVSMDYQAVKKHFEVFSIEPLWQDAAIEYFRYSGITTSNKEIAQLATKERIKSIFSKLSVSVRTATTEDKQLINI